MQTISIAKRLWKRITTIATTNGDRVYRAAIGNRQSTGKSAGEALDALTIQMGGEEVNG
ncbi:hypothetical protein [Chamaesiphon sp. VAR_48_metabat_403]|uniref:hypothetical protein n=1 Tax=Chamaesiphon sp. VAR_48_metabat_403 TaxID=2964700 RepID=UPI00286E85FA|nr:hypothetical protein [Chamaesiphon sp. VAR_48_metabat_403]